MKSVRARSVATRLTRLGVAATAMTVLGACGGGGNSAPMQAPVPTPPPRTILSATPARHAFTIAQLIPPPLVVQLSGNVPLVNEFAVSVVDPTQVGASRPTLTGTTQAQFKIIPVSHGQTGSTVVEVLDDDGPPADVSVSQGACGRPDNLSPASQLLFPKPGATHVPPSVGAAYFAVVSRVAPSGRLHLIVWSHETLEGGMLVLAAPPPGSPTIRSPGGLLVTTMKATLPTLPKGATITTQLYDDTCQPPLLVGSFST